MKSFIFLSVLSLFLVSCNPGTVKQNDTSGINGSPNFLLVMVDDMGWSDIGPFGSEIETPSLDNLASEGIKYTNFYTSVSCSPTRAMLLSGNDNHVAGLGNMGEMMAPEQEGQPGYEGYMNRRVVSFAEVLKDNGYHTYMAGKWHLGRTPEFFPHGRGFERSFALLSGAASHWSDMTGVMGVAEPVSSYVMDDKKLEELPDDFYSTRSYSDFVIDAIRSDRGDGKPFVAYLAFTTPHNPLHVPEPWLSNYKGNYDEGYEVLKDKRTNAAKQLGLISENAQNASIHPMVKPWNSLSEDEKAISSRSMEVYAGMVSNMDYHLGRVLNFLKAINEYDNTIIIFFSDNGADPWFMEDYPTNSTEIGSKWLAGFDNSLENIGSPQSQYGYGMGWASACVGPFDRFKMTVSEGGIRSPMIIAGPGIEGGRQSDNLAYVWDIMATMLDYAGASYPAEYNGQKVEKMRGKSLKSVLTGEAEATYGLDDYLAGEMQNGMWVRKGSLKAVSVAPLYGNGEWHLYDLSVDPGETNDLSGEQPEVLEELQEAWQQYADDVKLIMPKK